MENLEILSSLKKIVSEDKIKINEPMKNHTSFRTGGPADFFVKVNSIEELNNILELINENNIPLTIVGNGSNLLITDKGIRGIVIKINMKEISILSMKDNKKEVTVDSGVLMGGLAQKLLQEGISGFEELSGIPGTVGGAIVMNAGAHGKEIKDIVTQITAIDYNGKYYKFNNEDAEFKYRNSKFSNNEYIIIQAKFVLETGKKEKINLKMKEFFEYRKDKQPIEFPSAGSTFKRGKDYITAQLIDKAGLKGYKIGGAEVSTKHAGFIVNTGNATSKDIIDLIEYIKQKVYEKFKKNIELEIKVLGE